MKRLAALLGVFLALATVAPADAHKPIFVAPLVNAARPNAVPIADPGVSWAVYAQLSTVGEVNYYTFSGKRGTRVEVDMSTPVIEALRGFAVSVALLGIGLPEAPADAPYMSLAGEGALVAPARPDTDHVFDEPFTATRYWRRQTLAVTLPQDGAYTLAVFSPAGETGKYVLAIGEREDFGPADLASFPSIRARVQAWFNAPLEPVATKSDAAPVSAVREIETRGAPQLLEHLIVPTVVPSILLLVIVRRLSALVRDSGQTERR